jgi:hypothetical protein
MATNNPALVSAIHKLAVAGERAGFTIEQMVELLKTGMSVDALLDIIAFHLDDCGESARPPVYSSSCWVM